MTKWFKLAAVTTVFAFGAMMIGCTDDNPLNPETKINISLEMPDSVQAGTTQQIKGTITSDPAIESWNWAILDPDGAEAENISLLNNPPNVSGESEVDLSEVTPAIIINVNANACDGKYFARVTVKAPGGSFNKDIAFFVYDGTCAASGTPVSTFTLGPIGAQNAMAGSSVDVETNTIYTSADARVNSQVVDFVYGSLVVGDLSLISPQHAKSVNLIFTGDQTVQTTEMAKVTASFASITTEEALIELFNGATTRTDYVSISAGDVVVLKTFAGTYALVEITSQTPGTDGTINIKLAKPDTMM